MTLGVLGTMVWDEIHHPDGEVVERWGGITYSLAAAAAALPEGWRLRPVIKLGRDLAAKGRAFLDAVPGLDEGGVLEVAEPNNRVTLRYRDRQHRDEYLTGGVPGWNWNELAPLLRGLDGLYVNLISGFELDLPTARSLSRDFAGPRYVDLHSLVLGMGDGGHRVPRALENRERWLGAFHAVQMNEEELAEVAQGDETEAVAREAAARGTRIVFITRGPVGGRWLTGSEAPLDLDHPVRDPEALEEGELPPERAGAGDPTGCGDVWGATCFVTLMQGASPREAAGAANRAASRNLDHRGAEGLYQHLRSQ